ncbi:hypothetical protein BH10ACT5_BH10ACT5_10550 [soil metagenome]
MRRRATLAASLLFVLAASGCTATSSEELSAPDEPLPESTVTTVGGGTAEFAIITDFGNCDDGERQVAEMVTAWNPQIIATAGDNTQGTTGCVPFEQSVGDYYSEFVAGPDGPAFFPVPGNHDYENEGAGEAAYLDYFAYLGALSDNPLWYEVSTGNVNLFMLDSEVTSEQLAEQRDWLQAALSEAQSAGAGNWNIVMFHRPPFTSGPHEPNVEMRPEAGWEYGAWGADLVVTGHQHVYEELEVDGLPYLVAGVGASGLARPCPTELADGSSGCVEGYGAILVTANDQTLTLDYRKPDGASGATLRSLVLSRDQ